MEADVYPVVVLSASCFSLSGDACGLAWVVRFASGLGCFAGSGRSGSGAVGLGLSG